MIFWSLVDHKFARQTNVTSDIIFDTLLLSIVNSSFVLRMDWVMKVQQKINSSAVEITFDLHYASLSIDDANGCKCLIKFILWNSLRWISTYFSIVFLDSVIFTIILLVFPSAYKACLSLRQTFHRLVLPNRKASQTTSSTWMRCSTIRKLLGNTYDGLRKSLLYPLSAKAY